jgi:hypothetical protein
LLFNRAFLLMTPLTKRSARAAYIPLTHRLGLECKRYARARLK